MTFFSEFSYTLAPFVIFHTLVRVTNYFHVIKAEFHTKNIIFKVEYLTKEQKRAKILNGLVQSDDKRSQKLQD